MTRKEIDKRCARIRSMEQLRAERQRIDWMIETREEAIQKDLAEVRELFSWDYLSGMAMSAIQPFASGLIGSIQTIMSLFRRSSGRKK